MRDHGRLPALDWATIVAFIGIAGAGGLSNTLFSNYARDKGWGMGAHVGAIPSAIGGRTIGLSHIGCAFRSRGRQPGAMAGLDAAHPARPGRSGSSRRSWGWRCLA